MTTSNVAWERRGLLTLGAVMTLCPKRETTLIKRCVSKAKVPIRFHTANGPTRTENVANIHVRELDHNITPIRSRTKRLQFLQLVTGAWN